jgi:hypothetical protein
MACTANYSVAEPKIVCAADCERPNRRGKHLANLSVNRAIGEHVEKKL